MGIGHENIGLPTKTVKRYITQVIDGHTVKSVNKMWHGVLVGWNVWVDDKLYFKNCLLRAEAINKALEQAG